MSLLVLARRTLARHPVLRWVAVAVLAGSAALVVAAHARAVDEERASWGASVPVWVARSAIEPGTVLGPDHARSERYPAAMVPPGAIAELGGTARQHIGTGEILVASDVGAAVGPAALVPAGWAALAVPAGGVPVAPGDAVAVATGDGISPGIVVGGPDATGAALIAVGEEDVAAVAAATVVGDAVLVLSASPPAP